jgi:DNA-directed RNA polymerase subunit RPC12/RpoP
MTAALCSAAYARHTCRMTVEAAPAPTSVPPTEPSEPSEPPAPRSAAARAFACPACGAAMAFDPQRSALACSACGHARLLPEPSADAQAQALREQDYLQALRRLAAREPTLQARVVDCPACGAQTRFEGHVVGDVCAFCASPLLVEQAHEQMLIRAQAVLPFALNKAAAQQVFARWVGGLWFAPNALQATVREADGVKGVYMPWWTYDANTISTYRGERGEHRTVYDTRTDASGRSVSANRTVTDWSPAAGAVPVAFDDLLVAGSPSVAPHLARVLDGWNLAALQPLAEELLAGFQVEVHRIGLEEGFGQARGQMQPRIDQAIRNDIGGDVQRIAHQQTVLDDIRFKHLLLPVWIGSYRFKGKAYQIVVNGQSGEVEGDRPWSAWKIALAVAAVLLVVLVLLQLSGQ